MQLLTSTLIFVFIRHPPSKAYVKLLDTFWLNGTGYHDSLEFVMDLKVIDADRNTYFG